MVVFPRIRKQEHPPQKRQTTTSQGKKGKCTSSSDGIQVRMFDENFGKFLETKTSLYKPRPKSNQDTSPNHGTMKNTSPHEPAH